MRLPHTSRPSAHPSAHPFHTSKHRTSHVAVGTSDLEWKLWNALWTRTDLARCIYNGRGSGARVRHYGEPKTFALRFEACNVRHHLSHASAVPGIGVGARANGSATTGKRPQIRVATWVRAIGGTRTVAAATMMRGRCRVCSPAVGYADRIVCTRGVAGVMWRALWPVRCAGAVRARADDAGAGVHTALCRVCAAWRCAAETD